MNFLLISAGINLVMCINAGLARKPERRSNPDARHPKPVSLTEGNEHGLQTTAQYHNPGDRW